MGSSDANQLLRFKHGQKIGLKRRAEKNNREGMSASDQIGSHSSYGSTNNRVFTWSSSIVGKL